MAGARNAESKGPSARWKYDIEVHGGRLFITRIGPRGAGRKEFLFSKPHSEGAATVVKTPWRYVAEKTPRGLEVRKVVAVGKSTVRKGSARLRTRGKSVKLKPGSKLDEKLTEAFRSAVKAAP